MRHSRRGAFFTFNSRAAALRDAVIPDHLTASETCIFVLVDRRLARRPSAVVASSEKAGPPRRRFARDRRFLPASHNICCRGHWRRAGQYTCSLAIPRPPIPPPAAGGCECARSCVIGLVAPSPRVLHGSRRCRRRDPVTVSPPRRPIAILFLNSPAADVGKARSQPSCRPPSP